MNNSSALIIESIIFIGIGIVLVILSIVGGVFALAIDAETKGVIFWGSVPLGIFGISGAMQLARKVVNPNKTIMRPQALRWRLACGLMAILIQVFYAFNQGILYLILILVPLLGIIHFTYLERNYVFSKSS